MARTIGFQKSLRELMSLVTLHSPSVAMVFHPIDLAVKMRAKDPRQHGGHT